MRSPHALPYVASSALVALATVCAPPSARAQARAAPDAAAPQSSDDASLRARARYDAGTQSFGQSRFVEAALEFEAAASVKPNSVALYTAALSWERANAPERAADDYRRALVIGGLPTESAATAVRRVQALEGVLGTLVAAGPGEWQVQLDGDSEVPAPATLHGSEGVHTLTVRSPVRPITRVPVTLRAGATTRVDLPVATPAPPGAFASTAPRAPLDGRAAAGWLAVGAATAVLLSGVLLRVEAVQAGDTYDSTRERAWYDRATNLQTWTNVAWVTGGTLLPTGLALLLWPRPTPAPPVPVAGASLSDAWMKGRF